MDESPDPAAPTATAAGVRPVSIKTVSSASAENRRPASAGGSGWRNDKSEYLRIKEPDDIVPASVPQAYILEWGENTPCTRTELDMGTVAQSVYAGKAVSPGSVSATVAAKKAASTRAPSRSLPKSHEVASSHRLYVIRDTADEQANSALCSDLDVDPGFFAAHIDGRRYRRRGWRRRSSDNAPPPNSAAYSFPQVLVLRVNKFAEQEERRRASSASIDGGGRAGLIPRDCPVAVFCRASLWESARTSILLLDNSPSSTTLEDALMNALNDATRKHSATIAAGMVHSVVAQLVHDQWLDFFDTITTGGGARQPRRIHVNKKMYKDMAWVLEQNLVASRLHDKAARQTRLGLARDASQSDGSGAPSPAGPPPAYETLDPVNADDWRELIARLDRMVALLALQKPKKPVATEPSDTMLPTDIPAPSPFSGTPQEQNSLGRVTYMGGILLPFSIIAGIMSMSDPYGPGSSRFWIYWAITIPITCLTLTIIYADDIRNMYVWQQISQESFQEAVRMGEAVPSNAVDAITDAAERTIDKLTSDEDSDIETEPVVQAFRPAEPQSGRRHRTTHVHIGTGSGSRKPTFYRIAEPIDAEEPPSAQQPRRRKKRQVDTEIKPLPAMSRIAVSAPSSIHLDQGEAEVGDEYNHELRRPLQRARRRRRVFVNPFAWIPASRTNANETVAIGMDRPSKDARPGLAVGRRIGGRNIAAPERPLIILQQGPDGSNRIYRREQLGWAGALKSMVGYHTPPQA